MSELLNFDGTFEGIDLNVGDKVRIVRKSGLEMIGTIARMTGTSLRFKDDLVVSESFVDTIEVIERAPKPLPTEEGYYMAMPNTLYQLEFGVWYLVSPDARRVRDETWMQGVKDNRGLKRLMIVED